MDISFESKILLDTPLNGEELKTIDKSHGGSLNHWVGGLMHITVQTSYDLQYLTMRLSVYMNSPIEPYFLDLNTHHGISHTSST